MYSGPLPAPQVTRKTIELDGTAAFEHEIGLDELREGSEELCLTGRSLAPVAPEIDRRFHRSVRCWLPMDGFPADSNECASRRLEDSNLDDHTGPMIVVHRDVDVTRSVGGAV